MHRSVECKNEEVTGSEGKGFHRYGDGLKTCVLGPSR